MEMTRACITCIKACTENHSP